MLNYTIPLTDTGAVEILQNLEAYIDKSYNWAHASTGQNSPGLAFDSNYPIFDVTSWGRKYVIVSQTWASDESLITKEAIHAMSGFGFVQFVVNTPPDVSDVVVQGDPTEGTAVETQFSMSCSGGTSSQLPLKYAIGYLNSDEAIDALSSKDAQRCIWIVRNCMLFKLF